MTWSVFVWEFGSWITYECSDWWFDTEVMIWLKINLKMQHNWGVIDREFVKICEMVWSRVVWEIVCDMTCRDSLYAWWICEDFETKSDV